MFFNTPNKRKTANKSPFYIINSYFTAKVDFFRQHNIIKNTKIKYVMKITKLDLRSKLWKTLSKQVKHQAKVLITAQTAGKKSN